MNYSKWNFLSKLEQGHKFEYIGTYDSIRIACFKRNRKVRIKPNINKFADIKREVEIIK